MKLSSGIVIGSVLGVALCLSLGCSSPCPSFRLPATGQTKCYDDKRNVIDRTRAEYPGQDSFYHKGFPMAGRFIDNGDGTVTDKGTGLMWQKDTAPGGESYDWQQALQYCEDLDFAGQADWRLPNVRELQSIVDYGRFQPAIDPVFGVESGEYWSSSTYVDCPIGVWLVDFFDGRVNYNGDGVPGYVRAVRDAD